MCVKLLISAHLGLAYAWDVVQGVVSSMPMPFLIRVLSANFQIMPVTTRPDDRVFHPQPVPHTSCHATLKAKRKLPYLWSCTGAGEGSGP